jgi:hypothetical protein
MPLLDVRQRLRQDGFSATGGWIIRLPVRNTTRRNVEGKDRIREPGEDMYPEDVGDAAATAVANPERDLLGVIVDLHREGLAVDEIASPCGLGGRAVLETLVR